MQTLLHIYSIHSVNLLEDPASHSINSVKLVADPAKSCSSSNSIQHIDWLQSLQFRVTLIVADENNDEDYLNDISLERIWKHRGKGASPESKTDKKFSRSDLEQHKTWKNWESFKKCFTPRKYCKGLEPTLMKKLTDV